MGADDSGLAKALHDADNQARLRRFADTVGCTPDELSDDGKVASLEKVCEAMRKKGYTVHGPVTPQTQPKPGYVMRVIAIEINQASATLTIFDKRKT